MTPTLKYSYRQNTRYIIIILDKVSMQYSPKVVHLITFAAGEYIMFFSRFHFRVESSPKGEQTVKQLTKTISQLKKKIRDFEDAFEEEHLRRPSQSEKAPIKKYVSELGRARKQLKELKERAKNEAERLNETVPPMSGQGLKSSSSEPLLTTTPTSIEHSLESLLNRLAEKREEAGRPEEVELMGREQLQDEKLAVQKTLLQHESLFGRPTTKKDKDLMRPLYDRLEHSVALPEIMCDGR